MGMDASNRVDCNTQCMRVRPDQLQLAQVFALDFQASSNSKLSFLVARIGMRRECGHHAVFVDDLATHAGSIIRERATNVCIHIPTVHSLNQILAQPPLAFEWARDLFSHVCGQLIVPL